MGDHLPYDEATLRTWLINYIVMVMNMPGDNVPTDQTFESYGFDSVEIVVMAGVLEEEFGVQVDPVQLFEHSSIDAFAKHFTTATATSSPYVVGTR
jgi:acyl carrier protein